MIQTKKIKKNFYKDLNINKKKHYSLNEKKLNQNTTLENNEEERFFIKEINIDSLIIKVFVKNNKFKKQIIFRFYDDKKKEVNYSRLLTNEILIKIFNDKRKEKIFLNLLKQTPNQSLIKKRLKEIYKNVPQSIQEWINEKNWIKDYPFHINIDQKIPVLFIKEATNNLNADNNEEYFDYYFDVYSEEKKVALKKKMVGYNIINLDLKDLFLNIYESYSASETPIIYNNFYSEKYCEEICVTPELNNIIFEKIEDNLKEEWTEFYNHKI